MTKTAHCEDSDKPFKIRLFVCGYDSGCYDFPTQEEADEHYDWSTKHLGLLGCSYRKEYPNTATDKRRCPDFETGEHVQRIKL